MFSSRQRTRRRLLLLRSLAVTSLFRGGDALRVQVHSSPSKAGVFIALYDVGLAPGASLRADLALSTTSSTSASSSSSKSSSSSATAGDDIDAVLVLFTKRQWTAWFKNAGGVDVLAWPSMFTHGVRQWWPAKPPGWPDVIDPEALGQHVSSYMSCALRVPAKDNCLNASTIIRGSEAEEYYLSIVFRGTPQQRGATVVTGSIQFVNPGEQELPLQAVGLPEALKGASLSFLALMGAVYLGVAIMWSRGATLLHALLLACMWFKFLWLALRWSYWEFLTSPGGGQFPRWTQTVYELVGIVDGVLERLLLMLIALGWRVVRMRLTNVEARIAMVSVLSLTSLAVLELIFGGTSAFWAIRALSCMIWISTFLVIIVGANINIALLTMHIEEAMPTPGLPTVLYQKHWLYTCFRRILMLILCRPLIIFWLQTAAFGTYSRWCLVEVLQEGSQWLIYASLFYILRPGGNIRGFVVLLQILAMGRRRASDGAGTPAGNSSGSMSPLPTWWREAVLQAANFDRARGGSRVSPRAPARPRAEEDPNIAYVSLSSGENSE